MNNLESLLEELNWAMEVQEEDVFDWTYTSEEIQYLKMDLAEACQSQDCLTCPCKQECPF